MNPSNRLVMVMGGSDTGKTTLVERVAGLLSGDAEVGVVDLDMGQSHIGPPTTIAWGKARPGLRDLSGVVAEDFYFTGTVSPMGSLLPAVVGAKMMTDKALSSCKRVVVDTTGLIAEPSGRVLKQHKIDLLSPDIILALEHSEELSHILDSFRSHELPKIHRLSVPREVRAKTVARRSQFRFEKMKEYLLNAGHLEVSIEDVALRFTGRPPQSLHDLKDKIVSFRDEKNKDIALGFVEGVLLREKRLRIRTPLEGKGGGSSLVIGRTKMDMANSFLTDKL